MRRLDNAAPLDAAQHRQQLGRVELRYWPGSDVWKHVALKSLDDLDAVALCPVASAYVVPLARDMLEAVQCRKPSIGAGRYVASLHVGRSDGLSCFAGVNPLGYLLACVLGPLAGHADADRWIGAKRECFALALDAVVKAPSVCAALHEEQDVEAIPVRNSTAWVAMFDGTKGGVGTD